MRTSRPRLLSIAVTLLAVGASSAATGQPSDSGLPPTYGDGLRRWTAEDSVSQLYLSRHGTSAATMGQDAIGWRAGSWRPGDEVLWSPDRAHFVILTYRGDPGCDCRRYDLMIYSAAQIAQLLRASSSGPSEQPRPVAQASFATRSSNFPGIVSPEWTDDETVLFAGNRDGFRQLFTLSARTGALTQLTRIATPPNSDPRPWDDYSGEDGGVGFPYALRGDALLFPVIRLIRRPTPITAYPSTSIAEERLVGIYSRLSHISDLYLSSPGHGDARIVAQCVNDAMSPDPLSLSPNGRWAVFPCARIRHGGGETEVSVHDINLADVPAFWLLDTQSGRLTRIASVASGARLVIAWRDDGGRAALLGAVEAAERCRGSLSERPDAARIVVLDPARGDLSCVASAHDGEGSAAARAAGIRWVETGGLAIDFRVRTPRRRFERIYTLHGEAWQAGPDVNAQAEGERAANQARAGLSVQLRQSANEPWSLVASLGSREVSLLGPDPALSGVWREPVRDITWREGNFTIHGGLILPRDYRPGTRLPMVIQVGLYLPDQFLTDGSATTVFAAQALAAQGMAVLNVTLWPEPGQASGRTTQVEEVFRDRVDTMVATLAGQGLIDPQRVGLVGFSHTGYQAHYLATHPGRINLAAVIAADSTTLGYGEYVMGSGGFLGAGAVARQLADHWGGSFWERRDVWVQNAPLFNVQNITAPILFQLHTTQFAAIGAAEILGAYRLMNKPFEFFLFPRGDHQLRRPRERITSMNNNVSWMAFWLQDREVPGLQTEETYARWRRMRELRDRNAQAAAPTAAVPATP